MRLAARAGERKARLQAKARVRDKSCTQASAADLLAWYDRHRRVLPWRAKAGETADPYRVWLSEIMLQQTTVTAVAPYYARFLERFPDIFALAAAPTEDVLKAWAGLGYYARARNLHACARDVVAAHGGTFPRSEQELAALPGIGPYTAAAIAAIAYDIKATAVDGNVERVVTRLYAVEAELPAAKGEIRAIAAGLTPDLRPGDFAQAMMDLGATICTPQKPACALCPWMEPCVARRRGDADTFPRKAAKKEGRLRGGAAFVAVTTDGRLLVRTRPDKGLLGGMTEVPGSDWSHDFDASRAREAAPPLAKAVWRRVAGTVTHVFTHFPLELVVYATRVPASTTAPEGMRWIALDAVAGEALPNVMRKVVAHATGGPEHTDKRAGPGRQRGTHV
ncbi:A/G-specific adenine glycosylase [Xanthobacteraceae bacterium Astr-EGSB]|uniref:A/G-specific adenine glycosylase n=1 Tax=Astrobacterium formosum TaxID=3069710 RepID=UPI0027B781B1|nr:A/G-specific adenine glycosylase [Xanthobacteraceae bacterium Astr-EGSB]